MVRVSGSAGEVVVGELVAVSGAGLPGDLLKDVAGEDLGAEYGGYVSRSRIWRMMRPISWGEGSLKSEGWMAPMTSKP